MADEKPEVDLYEIPESELLALMDKAKQAGVEEAEPAVVTPPRDEKGRFLPKAEEEEEKVYRHTIDLGDGSGVQVFEGNSYEDLIEKLGKAQENATRKIRELSAAKKAEEKPAVVEPVVTEEEDWLLSQELMSTPSKAFPKLFEKLVGKPLTAFKSDMERLGAFERAQSEDQAAKSFMEKHPEYEAVPYNGRQMEKYIRTYKLEATPENIELAFKELSEGGLLKLKSDDNQPDTADAAAPERRIVSSGPRTVVIQKKAASGLSTKRSVAAPEPTMEDAYNMPMADLEKALGIHNGF